MPSHYCLSLGACIASIHCLCLANEQAHVLWPGKGRHYPLKGVRRSHLSLAHCTNKKIASVWISRPALALYSYWPDIYEKLWWVLHQMDRTMAHVLVVCFHGLSVCLFLGWIERKSFFIFYTRIRIECLLPCLFVPFGPHDRLCPPSEAHNGGTHP